MRYNKIPEFKIKVIPNCIPGEIPFDAKPFNSNCPLILQVGTKANKNIPKLLEALTGINCKLLILGEVNPELAYLLSKNNITLRKLYSVKL